MQIFTSFFFFLSFSIKWFESSFDLLIFNLRCSLLKNDDSPGTREIYVSDFILSSPGLYVTVIEVSYGITIHFVPS
jgi:hypothetical protein